MHHGWNSSTVIKNKAQYVIITKDHSKRANDFPFVTNKILSKYFCSVLDVHSIKWTSKDFAGEKIPSCILCFGKK